MKKVIEELYRLEGQTAVVTGAGRGIGRAVADLFAAAGARIVVADILAAEAEAAAAAIREAGGEAFAVTVDIADEPAVKQLYRQAAQQFSSVDVLIHCAAIFPKYPLLEIWELRRTSPRPVCFSPAPPHAISRASAWPWTAAS